MTGSVGCIRLALAVAERAMSLADSAAAFEQHCNRLVSDGSLHTLLAGQEIKSLSALAFAIGTPQAPPSDDQFKEFATRLNGGVGMTFGNQAALRRLHFESAAIVMAELKSKASDTSGDSSRRLPVAEKAARLREQEARLPGVRIRGELQPSYTLIDLVSQIKESDSITWIAPSKCSKRDAEVQSNLKERPVTLSLEQQMVKLGTQSRPVATVYSDVRVGCASRLMSCTYPVFTTRVYCVLLPLGTRSFARWFSLLRKIKQQVTWKYPETNSTTNK